MSILRFADLELQAPHLRPIRSGDHWRAGCPIHGSDKSRSLVVWENGGFYCHSCNAKGTTEESKEEWRKKNQQLPKRTYRPPALPLPKGKEAPELFDDQLLSQLSHWQSQLERGRAYLESRSIPIEVARSYGLGFVRQNEVFDGKNLGARIVIPHTNPDGEVVSIYSRATDPDSKIKHYHLKGRQKGMFNAPALREKDGLLFVTEGAFDALSLIVKGYRAVAIFGLDGLRWEWVREREIVLALDADGAGEKGIGELAKKAQQFGIKLKRLTVEELGGCKDVNEALVKDCLCIEEQTSVKTDISKSVSIPKEAPEGTDLNRWAIYRSICEQYGRQAGWTDKQLFSLPDTPGSLNAGIYWLVSGMSGWDKLEFTAEDVLVGGVLRFERQRLKV
jgi:DNA primase